MVFRGLRRVLKDFLDLKVKNQGQKHVHLLDTLTSSHILILIDIKGANRGASLEKIWEDKQNE